MENHLIVSVVSMTIAVTVFTAGLLLTQKTKRQDYRFFLAVFFVLYMLIKTDELFILIGGYHYFPNFLGVLFPIKLFLAPAIYFYVRSLVSDQQQWFHRKDILALTAPLMAMAVASPFYLLSAADKIALMSEATRDPELYKLALLGCQIGLGLFIAVSLIYLYASFKLVLQNMQRVRMFFSRIDDKSLTWLRFVLIVLTLGWTSYGINEIWSITGTHSGFVKFSIALFELLWIGLIAFHGLQQHPINTTSEQTITQSISSYAKSKLSHKRLETIAQRLDRSMIEDLLFQNPDLSLRQLSDQIGISENHISETFSRHFNKNFFDYVNGHRITLACQKLQADDQTILDIAMDVGFNSRSTFNADFKKQTGNTPSQYRKHLFKSAIRYPG